MAASFSSQLITLFIYDNNFSAAAKVFELFLLDGENILVDLIAGMIQHRRTKIVAMEDVELMEYLRKEMVQECFLTMQICDILKHPATGKPIKVKLTFNSL